MIRSFRSRDTEQLFKREIVKRFSGIERSAQRKLALLDSAVRLSDLLAPAGNRLEALKGNRKGQYSIRIDSQWRICFVWEKGDAYDVEIVDYH